MRLVFNCIFWYLLVIVHDQSGIKCGVSSQRKFAIFLAHSAESGFHNKKCCILTFPKKVQYFSVLRQNKNSESPKMPSKVLYEALIRSYERFKYFSQT